MHLGGTLFLKLTQGLIWLVSDQNKTAEADLLARIGMFMESSTPSDIIVMCIHRAQHVHLFLSYGHHMLCHCRAHAVPIAFIRHMLTQTDIFEIYACVTILPRMTRQHADDKTTCR